MSDATALDDATFARLIDALGPFETAPVLAVAVSGGADSLALCLLAGRWARLRGGRAIGVTVDHGLRPEAVEAARQVGCWLSRHRIEHHILRWDGQKPVSGVQAAARTARYDLLGRWCAAQGILHLLLAHHCDDQAETVLMRLARGSGVDGLSAMAPIVATPRVRLLRPLLSVSHVRLMARLKEMGQPWIEDPSNANGAFERVRWRRLLPKLAVEGMDAPSLAESAARCARARHALEATATTLMVRAVRLDPAGFARIRSDLLADAAEDLALRVLGRVCRCVAGGDYPPRLERLERLWGEMLAGLTGRRTFAGCVMVPDGQDVLICREAARVEPPLPVSAGEKVFWDHRFSVTLGGRGEGRIAALGRAGWAVVRDAVGKAAYPASVLVTLPTLIDQHGISAVPHLGYKRAIASELSVERLCFTPANGLSRV